MGVEFARLKEVLYMLSLILLIVGGLISLCLWFLLFLVMGYAGLVFNVPALAINTVVIVSALMYKKNHDFRNLVVSYVFGLLLSTVLFFFVFKGDPGFFTRNTLLHPPSFLLTLGIVSTLYFLLESACGKKKELKKLVVSLIFSALLLVLMLSPVGLLAFLERMKVPEVVEHFLALSYVLLLDVASLLLAFILLEAASNSKEKFLLALLMGIIGVLLILYFFAFANLLDNFIRIYIIGPEFY